MKRSAVHQPDGLLENIETWDVEARSNGRAYRIFISCPTVSPPGAGYPVLYMTDANLLFATMAQQAAIRCVTGELQSAIVVAVGYSDLSPGAAMAERLVDFAVGPAEADARSAKTGTDGLRDFLSNELIPAIDSHFPTDPARRSLFGFSLGGLFTLKLLFSSPGQFECFMIASPSVWFDEANILQDLADLESKGRLKPRVLVTVGSLEQSLEHIVVPPGMAREQAMAMTLAAQMVDKSRYLAERLQRCTPEAAQVVFSLLEGETHSSAPAAAIGRALGFAFLRAR